MAGEICKNHPGRDAIGHCATCHIPLCEKCVVKAPGTDKIFCSEKHAEQYMAFEERLGGKRITTFKQPSIFVRLLKGLIGLVVLFAIAWAIARFAFGMDLIAWIRGFLPF